MGVLTGILTVGNLLIKGGDWLANFAAKKSDAAVEKYKVDGAVTKAHIQANAEIVKTGMGVKWFWIPWSIAAIPTATWYAQGILDSQFNGALPDTAALPPQLLEFAVQVWGSLFISGGAVATAQTIAGVGLRAIQNFRSR